MLQVLSAQLLRVLHVLSAQVLQVLHVLSAQVLHVLSAQVIQVLVRRCMSVCMIATCESAPILPLLQLSPVLLMALWERQIQPQVTLHTH